MIDIIKSSELKIETDLVCAYCGVNHDVRDSQGNLIRQEGKDYVFERKDNEEYCICIECQKECDTKGLY